MGPTGAETCVFASLPSIPLPVAFHRKPNASTDWKCQMQIYDQSVENDFDRSLTLNVFRPEKEMPDVQCGDVIVVFAAKARSSSSRLTLQSNRPG